MMPITPLMIEHRLIERIIALMKEGWENAQRENRVNARFIESVTHFIKAYADECHHGKEENILFRELEKKSLSDEHQRILEELMEEHRQARDATRALVDANAKYKLGNPEALSKVLDGLEFLIHFYPKHIEKEDKHFFLPVMDYFSDQEKQVLLEEGCAFDSDLLHQDYADMITEWESTVEEGRDWSEAEAFSLPHCRKAPDPEHHRGEDEDEPCDDARAMEYPET